jgi:uncharacterized protein YndB with AHSA1/START domain
MKNPTIEAPARAFEMSLDLAASPEDVWRALTVAEELTRWFPVQARVTPGPGGSMVWSWGENWDWSTRIDGWEPGRLLRLVQEDARPYDAQGRPLPEGQAAPARIAMEFTLESHRGKTRLRVVHSGFGTGAAWDDEVEGITEGWQAELASLRHYLERHRGQDRTFRIARLFTSLSREEAWTRLIGPGGFQFSPADVKAGQAYDVLLPGGGRLGGIVALHLPRQTLAGTVRELDDGWFRILTWSVPGGGTGVWAGVATYQGDGSRVEEIAGQAEQGLQRLFARGGSL